MKQRFLSIILSVTLLASAIAGAISVSINFANADTTFHSDTIYWGDFRSHVEHLMIEKQLSAQDITTIINILNRCERNLNNPRYNIIIAWDHTTGACACSPYYQNNEAGTQGWFVDATMLAQNVVRYNLNNVQQTWYRDDIKTWGWFSFNGETFNHIVSIDTNHEEGIYVSGPWHFHAENFFPSPYVWDEGLDCYCSQSIVNGTSYNGVATYSYAANISDVPIIPEPVEFSWKKFNVGERWYVTTTDQSYMYRLFNDGEGNYLRLFTTFQFDDESEHSAYVNPGGDLIRLPDYFVTGLTNVRDDTIYAIEITDLLDSGLVALVNSSIWSVSENSLGEIINNYQVAYNNGFNVALDPNQENPSLNSAWQQFNTYVTEYNTTHVIPEQLGDWLFETNGSKLFPCSVQVPSHIWYNKFQTTSAPNNHVWRWGGTLIQEEGFQYSLYDVIIVGESDSGYGIRYFYDDTLEPSYNYIDEMLFANLIDSFDVVIIVPESEGILYDIPGVNIGPVGYTGSSSAGVIYTNDPLVGNTLQGFCILTERAIAKQQLWNFNEGISKLYDLEVKYIDSEDKWKNSFLLWSASMFDMVNSLDGRLNTINNTLISLSAILDSIKTAVDHMAYDDDPENLQPWYLSLWNWISNFRPSDSDFSATLNQYDNNWEEFPELPAPSTVPLLPGGE